MLVGVGTRVVMFFSKSLTIRLSVVALWQKISVNLAFYAFEEVGVFGAVGVELLVREVYLLICVGICRIDAEMLVFHLVFSICQVGKWKSLYCNLGNGKLD